MRGSSIKFEYLYILNGCGTMFFCTSVLVGIDPIYDKYFQFSTQYETIQFIQFHIGTI